MRLPVRSAAAFVLAIGLATCTDAPSLSPTPANAPGKGRLAIVPVFSSAAAAVLSQRSAFAEVTFDHVRIVLIRPPSEVVLDTNIVFTPGAPPVTLDLTVEVRNVGESFTANVEYTSNGAVVFRGTATVQSHAADEPAPPGQEIAVQYVGVGSTTTRLVMSPKGITVQAPNTTTFSVTAFDAAGNAVSGVPVSWSSSDPTVATIGSATGVLVTTGRRGTTTVAVRAPTGTSDNTVVTVALPATGITLVSGGGQTGRAGAALALPGVVRVVASDGVGVAGVSVTFAAPAGGSVGSASVTTDANGQASTSLTLGGTAGPQSFAAAAGAFSVSIPATATAADPSSIVAFSGSGQADTVRRALRLPFVAKVTDRFGNPNAGVTVTWARTAGTGTLGGTTSVTGADGTASIGYTLGSTVGTETVTATASGVAGSATFTATAITSGPAAIVAVSGSGQVGRATQPLGAPFVVRVTDDAGGPVSGASVSWTAINGTFGTSTTTTDADGQSSNTMTLGGTVGAASATATAGGKSVTFTATVQPGIVARMSFRAPPPNAAVGAALTPPVQVELRDAAGNLTAAANAVTIALGANPGGATLTGTLTRTSASGVATFDDLKLDKPGTGYTLVASSAGLPNVTSAPFNITGVVVGPAFKLAITTQPSANAVSGVPLAQQPVIQVQDANGNAVSSQGIQVAAVWSPGSERNNVATTSATGTATFTNLYLLGVASGPIVFSATGLQSVTSNSVTVSAAPAASMTLVDGQTFQPLPASPPPSVVMTAGRAPVNPPAIKIADANGTGVGNVTITYTVSRAGSPIFGGNATTDAQGIITFATLLISPSNLTVAGNYVFTATLSGVSGSPINLPVTVVPDAAAAVRFSTTFPTGGTAGTVITPAIPVAITDQYGNVITTATDNITIAITAGTGTTGAILSGTRTRAAVNGIATFNDLSIDRPGTNYTLTASAAAVAGGVSAVSPAFSITTGAATKFIVTANPTSPSPGGTSVITAQLADANNNPVATPTARTVNWTLTGGGGSVAPGSSTTNAQGVATTTYTAPTSGSGSPVITATDAANSTITGSVTLTPSVPAAVTAVTPVNVATVDPSQPLPATAYPAVRVTNSSGAPVPNVSVRFNFVGGQCMAPNESSFSDVITDANGVAALSATTMYVDRSRDRSCLVYASTGGIPQVIISLVIVPTTGIRPWIGVTSGAWNVATNWYNGIIPTAGDSVWVPAYVLQHPTLVAATTVSTVRFEDFAPSILDVGAFVLTITGDLMNSGGTITTSSTGSVVFAGSGTRTVSGIITTAVTIGSPTCGGAQYSISANPGVLFTQNLTVNCPLTLPALASVQANGNIVVQGSSGRFMMNGNSSLVFSSGDMTFDGTSGVNYLNAGALYVGRNLIIGSTNGPSAFVQGPNQDLYFQDLTGATNPNHTITISPSASPIFGRLNVLGALGLNTVTVAGSGNLIASALLVGQDGALVSTGTITAGGALGQGNGSYGGVTRLVVTGTTFPQIAGAAPVLTVLTAPNVTPLGPTSLAGSLEVQGVLSLTSAITIGGNFSVTGAGGELSMPSAAAATLTVGGNVTFAGRASTLLQRGTLVVGGNFSQLSTVSASSFVPDTAIITRFSAGTHRVDFAAMDSVQSHFAHIDVVAGSNVTFDSRVIAFSSTTNSGQITFAGAGQSTLSAMFFQTGSSTTVNTGIGVHIYGLATWAATGVTVTLGPNAALYADSCNGSPPSGSGVSCGT